MKTPQKSPSRLSVEERIDALVSQMTVQEKVSLLSGIDLWRTAPIPRLGIPSVAMTDGPHGVRSDGAGGRPKGPATSFPTGGVDGLYLGPRADRTGRHGPGGGNHGMGCDLLLGPCVNIAVCRWPGATLKPFQRILSWPGASPWPGSRACNPKVWALRSNISPAITRKPSVIAGSSMVDERSLPRNLPAGLRSGGQRSPALDGDARLQPHQRRLRLRA